MRDEFPLTVPGKSGTARTHHDLVERYVNLSTEQENRVKNVKCACLVFFLFRKFVESVQHCTITLEKKDADAVHVLKPINAVLNSGGGIVLLKIGDFSRYKKGDLNKRIDIFWQTLEQKLNPMIQPSTYDDVFDKKLEGDTILLFIKATKHLCTVDYNMHLPFDAASSSRPTYEKVVDLLSKRESLKNHIPEVPLTDLPIDLLPKKFTYKKVLDFHESKQVQLKYFTKNGLFHPNKQRAQDKIAEHISSFGNGSGGMILIGIEDKTGETLGQEITADGKAEWESRFQAMINHMSETWSFTPIQGEHWDIKFFPVDGTKSSFIIVVLIAGMRNLGGIFTKLPKSFKLLNPSGSDGEEEIDPLDFPEWKQRMLRGTWLGQSKGEYIVCQGHH